MNQKNRSVKRLAVVGAGNMGSGIAQKMATEGFDVVLVDLGEEQVRRGLDGIRKTLAEGVERGIFRPDAAEAIAGRIRGTADWSELSDVDLVVEAVFEDADVKRRVFERLEASCRDDTVLGTNTSSFSVTDLARGARRPERILGLHYFYHPAKNRLVEVVPGAETSPEVTAAAWSLQEQLGKTPVASADASGFIVNRYFVPWLNEAVRLLEQDRADIATIEAACKKTFGVGMGPFELMNVTGIPIAMHAATTLGNEFGPFYAPAERLCRQVESGEPWPLDGTPDESRFPEVERRMLGAVYYVACALVAEGVGSIEDTDIGARVGLRWPRGPFEMINRTGTSEALELVRELCGAWDLPVPENLASRGGEPFSFRFVKSELRDGVRWLTVNRPDAMNALNETVVAQLHEAFREAAADDDAHGIVIGGAGKAFIAGADIRFFVKNIEAKDLDRIVTFTKHGHDLLRAIDECAKPVVARVHGLALGGGLELALACDRIVASDKAVMAFPETGIGIYPGLGGTQRTPRKIGAGLARWLIFTGQTIPAATAGGIGLADRVVPQAEIDAACLAEIDRAGARSERAALSEAYSRLESFFASQNAAALLAGEADTGGDAELARAAKKVSGKAPVAVRIADELIALSENESLEHGLEAELGRLTEIFSTRDAYHGLSSVGRSRPEFEGR